MGSLARPPGLMSAPLSVCERVGWVRVSEKEGCWARFMDTKPHAHPLQTRAAHTHSPQPATKWLPRVPAIKSKVSPPARVLYGKSTDWKTTTATPL